jgi:hypothetical protein
VTAFDRCRLDVLGGKVTELLVEGARIVGVSDGDAGVGVAEDDACLKASVISGRTISCAGVSAMGEPPIRMVEHSVNAGTPGL